MTTINRYPDAQAAADACGDTILKALDDARRARGAATLAVSGGSTPRLMFQTMAKSGFDWAHIDLFQVDERCVPPDHELSNFRMTREALLDHIHLAHGQIHRIEGELIPDEAAVRYADNIRDALKLQSHELPVFDVIQRGMGPDTHTASLFPGEPLIENVTGIAAAVWVEKMKQHRVTLLRGVLERARHTVMLVSGADKAEALKQVLTEPRDFIKHPCQIAADRAEWFVDNAAAAQLPQAASIA
jgi:6-phosphogluconolactonase